MVNVLAPASEKTLTLSFLYDSRVEALKICLQFLRDESETLGF